MRHTNKHRSTGASPIIKRLSLTVIAFCMLFSSIVGSGIATLFMSENASAIPLADGGTAAGSLASKMSLTDRVLSINYYGAMRKCLAGGTFDRGLVDSTWPSPVPLLKDVTGGTTHNIITNVHAKAGIWFGENFFVDTNYINGNSDGKESCNDILKKGTALWGYGTNYAVSKGSFLCDMMNNYKPGEKLLRTNDSSCEVEGSDPGYFYGLRLLDEGFRKVIDNKVYGGKFPTTTEDAGLYLLYSNAFFKGCGATKMDAPATGRDYKDIKTVDSVSRSIVTNTYEGGPKTDTKIVYYDTLGDNHYASCADIASNTTRLSAAYLKYLKENPTEDPALDPSSTCAQNPSATGCPGSDKTCGSSISGLGWLVCPLINLLTSLNDGMWKMVSGMLKINPLNQTKVSGATSSIYDAWGSIRSIANVLFAIFFLIIIFSQISNFGIDNYGIKKILPRLIVCAILVNASFVIVQLSVDLANIIGSSLYDLLSGLGPKIVPTWESLMNLILLQGTGTALAVGGVALAAGSTTVLYMVLPMVVMGALGLLAAILTLIFRQAIIPVLAILAPLAFVAYLLPNTETWFKKWRDMLLSMLMMYPIAAVLFGGVQFASSVIIASDPENVFNLMIGLIMLNVPLFSLPFIAKQGGPLLTKLNAGLNKLAENARAPLKDWSKSHEDKARAEYRADTRPHGQIRQFAERNGLGGVYNSPRSFNQAAAVKKANRADETETANAAFESKAIKNQIRGATGNVVDRKESMDNLHYAKDQLTLDKEKAEQRAAGTVKGQRLDEALSRTGMKTEALKEDTSHRVANSQAGAAAHQALREAKGRTEIDNKNLAHTYATSDAGRALDDASNAAEYVARADKANTAGRAASDPTLLDVRQEAISSEAYLQSVQDQDKQITTEATTEAGGADLVADGKLSAETVQGIQYAKRSSGVAASATSSADRVVKKEYSDAVAKSYVVGGYSGPGEYFDAGGAPLLDKNGNAITYFDRNNNEIADAAEEIPITATARAAASVDPQGIQHVQAIETAAQSREKGENVTAAGTLFAAQNYTSGPNGDYMKVVENGIRRDGSAASAEERQAAMDALVRTGDVKAMAKIQNQLSTMVRTGDPNASKLQQAYNAMLVSSSKKPKSSGGAMLGSLAAGNLTDTFEDGLIKYAIAGKFAASEFVSMDKDEIGLLANALTARPGDLTRAQKDLILEKINGPEGVLNDKLYSGSIAPEKLEKLKDLIVAATI